MALAYLVDTNIISELEKITSNPNVVAQIQKYRDQIAIASISWHELLYGYHRLPASKRKERVGHYVRDFTLFAELDIENWFEA
jgi:tRNA(fMet)-specific endonuclease VapC